MIDISLSSAMQVLSAWKKFVLYAVLLAFAYPVIGQEPIRIETNEVLVPVYVGKKHPPPSAAHKTDAILTGDMGRYYSLTARAAITNLTAADFRLFDDGKEQKIQSVSDAHNLYWDLRDNKGHHTEYIGIGGGKWSTTQWPPGLIADSLDFPYYIIGYALPISPEGSCHKIQVKVHRHDALVASRTEYCNTHHPASDPLNGSKLGELLEGELAKPNDKSFELSLLAVPFYSKSGTASVHIAVDWQGRTIKDPAKPNGILGMVFKRDGTLVTRFSDLADRDGTSEVSSSWPVEYQSRRVTPEGLGPPEDDDNSLSQLLKNIANAATNENRYEKQIDLAPGDYELRIVLGDGEKFGWAILPFNIKSPHLEELEVSQISLCKLISDVSAKAQRLPGTWTVPVPGYTPLASNETEFAPTADTRYRKGDMLYTYFEIYAPPGEREPEKIEAQILIVDLKNRSVTGTPEEISAASYMKPGSSVIPVGRATDISKLPKGLYRLDVRAADSARKFSEWRSATFTIE